MEKIDVLVIIKKTWDNEDLSLEDKIITISDAFYSVGLDIATTANYIKATPAEFDAFLSLSNLDDDIIRMISEANPPKTTWPLLASGNDDEIKKALEALTTPSRPKNESISEYVFQQMIEIAGDTPDQIISQLTGDDLFYLANKAKNFNMEDKKIKFLYSVAGQKKRGKVLSEKQIEVVISIFKDLADNNVIQRNSIDNDKELCDKVLDAIDR
ncbi:MAG: hypothetical protein IKS65_06640 [Bacteroidales bacterium]|nr:hypothetical protein [Bacteroidales bacterium]